MVVSSMLAERFVDRLCVQRGIRLARCTPLLGIDYSAGRRGHGSSFLKRMRKMRSRLAKVRRVGRFASNAFLFKSGLGPRIFYPLPVFGLATSKVKGIRRTFAANLTGWRAGNSSSLMLMFSGTRELDPLYSASLLPVTAWVKRFQNETYARRLMVSSWGHQAYTLKIARRPWSLAAGPAAATILSMRRIGWDVDSASLWVSHRGRTFDVQTCQFHELLAEIRAAFGFSLWTDLGTQVKHPELACLAQPVGVGVAVEVGAVTAPLLTLLSRRGKNKLVEPAERAALRAVISGGIWDPFRKWEAGFPDTERFCPWCRRELGVELDCTFAHLAWQCLEPGLVLLRREMDVEQLCATALSEVRVNNPLWTRACCSRAH